jgi:lactate permease
MEVRDIILGVLSFIPFLILAFGILRTNIKMHWITLGTVPIVIFLSLFWSQDIKIFGISIIEAIIISIIPIIWVVFAAVFTYFISIKTGAIEVIKRFLVSVTPDKNVQAVIIAFGFGGFLESVAGFGTAVAIPTGILVSLGLNPIKAAIISLVANSVPVAFGALGLPVIVLSNLTSEPLMILTKYVVIQLIPFSLIIPLAIAIISNEGFKGIKASIPDSIIIGASFTLIQTIVGLFVGPELVAVLGSLGAITTIVLIKYAKNKSMDFSGLLSATSNYIILFALIILTRVFNFEFLKEYPFTIKLVLGEEHFVKIDWLTTPGTLLLLASIIGAKIQGAKMKEILSTLFTTADKLKWSALTILSIVTIAKIMGNTGMITSAALIIALLSGKAYPFFSPLVGALGTFITGSDTSSNILLGNLQKETARKVGLDVPWIVASNTSGATAGKMISPQNIAVASSAVNLGGNEKEILKITLPICISYALILGVYVAIVSYLI